MTAYWPELEDQLEDLNNRASTVLTRHPKPDGLPAIGSWIRAVSVDDDLKVKPITPWHYVAGWNGYIGDLSLRCRRRPGSAISGAVSVYLGKPRWRRDRALLVEPERPEEGACRQCDLSLARDVEREVSAERAAVQGFYLEAMPSLEAIAHDTTITDAERGRRLRRIWTKAIG